MTAAIRDSRRPPDEVGRDALNRVVGLLAQCRGLSLTLSILAVQWASSRDEEEREGFSRAFLEERQAFLDAVAETSRLAPAIASQAEIATPYEAVRGFAATLSEMEPDIAEMDHYFAAALAEAARLTVYPALREIIVLLEKTIRSEELRQQADMADKSDLMDRILRDMGRIGRMIGSISINASVEAARAGGESGRAFQVIASEVRDLARQSETLLEEMKRRLAERTL